MDRCYLPNSRVIADLCLEEAAYIAISRMYSLLPAMGAKMSLEQLSSQRVKYKKMTCLLAPCVVLVLVLGSKAKQRKTCKAVLSSQR